MTYTPLDLVENYLRRFVSYPSEHALVAHILWIVHTYLLDCFDTTPRLAFMSEEKESGKTRALEVTELFVPNPLMAFSLSPAVAIRLVSQQRCTVLFDEIDSIFGNAKRQEANGDICAFLNAGYRRGGKSYRCNANSKKNEPEQFDAFAAVAVAGLRNLPDMLASRCILIRMKRRAPGEHVEPFRLRYHPSEAKPIAEALSEWCAEHEADIIGAEPTLPVGIEDRAADIWEPLLAIADAASTDWPDRARAAASHFAKSSTEETLTAGVELLAHIKEAFGAEQHLATTALLERLHNRDESPWREIRGRPLDGRGLGLRLKGYGIKSKTVRLGDRTAKGYAATDFADSWRRYLPAAQDISHKRHNGHNIDNENNNVTNVTDVTREMAEPPEDGDEPEPGSFEPDDPFDLGNIPAHLDRRRA